MVKMQAVQSALAVRRQRTRHEEARKAKERKESNDSIISTPRASVVTLDGHVYFDQSRENKRNCGHVTMFHVGGVLILIGLMLVIMALMPSYVKSNSAQKISDLLGMGSFFVFLGGLLTTISRFISNHEDEELNQYIKGRLTRSRSGHRLRGDAEACLSPSHTDRHKASHSIIHDNDAHESSSSFHNEEPEVHLHKNGHAHKESKHQHHHQEGSSHHDDTKHRPKEHQEPLACYEVSPSKVAISVDTSTLPHSASSDPVLSRIIEEDEEFEVSTEHLDSSLSICSSLETQALIEKTHSGRSGSKSSIKSSCKSIKLI